MWERDIVPYSIREKEREREAMCFHIVTIPPFSSFVSVFAKKHVVA
jgi:hypothetical protein